MKYFLFSCVLILFNYTVAQTSAIHKETNIGQTSFPFLDESRERPVITELWYPTNDPLKQSDKRFSPFKRAFTVADAAPGIGPYPLILISHGSGGNRFSLEWLAQTLVQKGYMVAAVDHWGGTHENKIPSQCIRAWERPLDISFALTQILNTQEFSSSINTNKIGVLGFSYGGYTALALAGAVLDYSALLEYYESPEGLAELNQIHEFSGLSELMKDESFLASTADIPPLKDKRITAFLAISPGTAQGFTSKEQFKDVTDPVFIIGCEADKVTPVARYARHYHNLIEGSQYFEFPGEVGHYVMLAQAIDQVKEEAPIPFTDHPNVDRAKVHREVEQLATSFFDQSLSKN